MADAELDQIKMIPQVFFDIIGRVVPGAVGIVAALLLTGKSWGDCVGRMFYRSETASTPTAGLVVSVFNSSATERHPEAGIAALSLFVFLAASYVVGQLLSPFAKLTQRLGECVWLRTLGTFNQSWRVRLWPFMCHWRPRSRWLGRRFLKLHQKLRPKQKCKHYDWLRLHYPGAGDQCAKIRAEFTMHNGIAVVLMASAVAYPWLYDDWSWCLLFALITGSLIEAYRGRDTRDTFNDTLQKFVDAAPTKPI